jgi:hypothetical protein
MDSIKIYEGFVEPHDCTLMIERLEYLCKIEKVTVRDDGRIGLINFDDPIFKALSDKYYNKALSILDDNFTKYNGYIVTKYVEGVGMSTHIDSSPNEEMGVLMYLNDDYEGGELTYTVDNQEYAIKPKKGDMAYCPSWYPHGVNIFFYN